MTEPSTRAALDDKPRGALAALCVTQTVGYGLLFYSLLVAVGPISKETGWSSASITGAFSLGSVVAALAGVIVGRLLDRRGPRVVIVAGSVLGGIGLALVAISPNLPFFFIAWIVVGFAQAATLYQVAFTLITRWYGLARVRPLTILTLVAGFASSIFSPLTAALLSVMSWRDTYLLFAAVALIVIAPLHWFFVNHRWTPQPEGRGEALSPTVIQTVTSFRFVSVTVAMFLLSGALYTVTLNTVPLLSSRGFTYGLAALTFGLIGAGQVLGRLLFVALPRTSAPRMQVVVVTFGAVICLALLAFVQGPTWLLVVASIAVGAVRGSLTLVQATAISARWGSSSYGSLNGIFAAPTTAVEAIAPVLGTLLAAALGGYPAMAIAMTVVAAGALFFAWKS